MRGKSITIDADWFDLISEYAEEHYMTKKDTLTLLLDIAIGSNKSKDAFFEWYLKRIGTQSSQEINTNI